MDDGPARLILLVAADAGAQVGDLFLQGRLLFRSRFETGGNAEITERFRQTVESFEGSRNADREGQPDIKRGERKDLRDRRAE